MPTPTDVRLAVQGLALRRIARALEPVQAAEVAEGLRDDDLMGLLAALGGPLDPDVDEALTMEARGLLDALVDR